MSDQEYEDEVEVEEDRDREGPEPDTREPVARTLKRLAEEQE